MRFVRRMSAEGARSSSSRAQQQGDDEGDEAFLRAFDDYLMFDAGELEFLCSGERTSCDGGGAAGAALGDQEEGDRKKDGACFASRGCA